MTLILTRDTLNEHIGDEVGVSPWTDISQDRVNAFAEVTIDPQFIHIDPERAAMTPFGGTVAHGFLVLSMLSYFSGNGMGVSMEGAEMGINYGIDNLRFISPVPVGKRIRGRSRLLAAEETKPGQFRFRQQVTVEIENQAKAALVGEWLTMAIAP